MAVASAENVKYPAYHLQVGGVGYAYRDSDGTTFLDQFAGQDLEYVMVPNVGAAEDFEGIDVQGKVAVISRGEITFEEKTANAANAGASAVVVYDNQAGSLISMAIDTKTIPAVFVSQEAGAALAAQAELTLHVDSEATIVDNPEAWSVSSFSSWGPTNDLQIKPVITAIGGNVNSVTAGTQNGYEVMSGTSMSSPNAAGGFAALLEAICAADPGLSKKEAADIARNRIASSALPLIAYAEEYGLVPYSPRLQGAGCMDLQAAYNTTLVVADPFAELGDDPARSGVYTITADVVNTADTERTYAVGIDVMTDAVVGDNFGTEEEPDFHVYNAVEPLPAALEVGVDYTLSAPESITLAPGEHQTVTVTITLTADMKEFLDAYFENGAFVDGYVYLDSVDADVSESQHVTFLAFYGDWAAAPIFETHDWRELMNLSEEEAEYWQYYVDWEIDTVPSEAFLVNEENEPMLYAGDTPFSYPEGSGYSDARIAVSNDADQSYSHGLLVAPVNVRNARHVIMIVRDAETGTIYGYEDTPFCRKIIFDPTVGWSVSCWFLFEGMDTYSGKKPVKIADDTKVVLEFYANLPWGEDELGSMTPEQIVSDGAAYLGYSVPCTVDGAAPVIESCDYNRQTGEVTVTVSDNQYLAAIYVVDNEGNELCEPQAFADTEPGKSHTVTMNVGEQNTFIVAAMDYATNESSVQASQQIFVAQQPQDAFAKCGDTVQFTVDATGNGLTYQWFYRQSFSKIWKASILPGARTATITVPATALRDGYQYRCELKDALGNRVTTDAATLTLVSAPVITQQPVSVTLCGGETAQFTVAAEGKGLSYQWQYRQPGASEWKDSTASGADTDTVSVKATATRSGRQYRCVVTNAAGSVISDAATMTVFSIQTQPKDFTGVVGDTATFTVKAAGTDLTYQWQYKDVGGKWKNSKSMTDTATCKITADRDGRMYRCIVKDANGNTLTSKSAKLTVFAIQTQPKDYTGAVGDIATFTVTASGTDLSYQWQYSDNNGKTWNNSKSVSAVATCKVTAARDGRMYRCIIQDAAGNTLTSDAATLTVK